MHAYERHIIRSWTVYCLCAWNYQLCTTQWLGVFVLCINTTFVHLSYYIMYFSLLSVIGLDYIASGNYSTVPIPKYNNKVQNPDIFDTTTRATLPMRMLVGPSFTGEIFLQLMALHCWLLMTGEIISQLMALHCWLLMTGEIILQLMAWNCWASLTEDIVWLWWCE